MSLIVSRNIVDFFTTCILYIKATCLSVCPSPETQIPKKTHTFSFQVSRNEGSVCLGTWRHEVSSDNEETWIWSRRYRDLKICNGSRGGDSRSQEMRGLFVLGTWRPIYRHMTRRFQVLKISRSSVRDGPELRHARTDVVQSLSRALAAWFPNPTVRAESRFPNPTVRAGSADRLKRGPALASLTKT